MRILDISGKKEKMKLQRMKELAHLCLILGWSKALRRNDRIASKALSGILDIALIGQWPLVIQTLNEGWLPMHKKGRQLKYSSASQKGDCTQKISIRIVVPHNPKVNVGLVLIHEYYQQIIRWREQLLICCVNKIEKNVTNVRRRRDHKHIGLLMKKILGSQLSCHHMARIEITFACLVWQFITQPKKHYKTMQQEGAL